MGTGPFALPILQGLTETEGIDLIAVYTKESKPAGRGMKVRRGAVEELALNADIPLYQVRTLRSDEAKNDFLALQADLVVVASYGLILPSYVLHTPPFGCVNVHGSLLPKYRGAAPIQRAVLDGETQTGVTLMQMDEGLDTGDILCQKEYAIGPEDTAGDVFDALALMGRDLLCESLPAIFQKALIPQKQDEVLSTYASKIDHADQSLDFSEHGKRIVDRIRALSPRPNAICHLQKNGMLLKIHKASFIAGDFAGANGEIIAIKPNLLVRVADGALSLMEIQPEGKRTMSASDIINGRVLALGDLLL